MKFVSRLVVAVLLMAQAEAQLIPPFCPKTDRDACGTGFPPKYQLCKSNSILIGKVCIAFPRIVKRFAFKNYECCTQ